MDIYMDYNENTARIHVIASIASESNETNQFSIWFLYANGSEYREYFHYNKTGKLLFVDFEISQSIVASTDIFVSVRDASYNIVYSTDVYNYSPNQSSNTPTIILIDVNMLDIADLSRSELIKKIQDQDYIIGDVFEIKKAILKYNISASDITLWITPTNTSSSGEYIPKYSSQGAEPNIINGIGNSSSYSSWRASQ